MRGAWQHRHQRRPAVLLGTAMLLSACVTRPAGTDIFGRPIGVEVNRTAAAIPSQAAGGGGDPDAGRTVRDGDADDLLAGIVLRPPVQQNDWSPAAVTLDARSVADSVYIVQPGDTLRGIGNRTGAGSEEIARANAMAAPYALRIGQRLAIPGGRYHAVRPGDTGIAIARAYGVDWSRVVADNGLSEPYALRVGQRLRLPPGPTAPLSAASGGGVDIEARALEFTLDIDDIVTGGTPAGTSRPTVIAPPVAPLTATRFAWPLTGRLLRRFGPAADGRINEGVNIAAARGTPVTASADGIVAYAGSDISVFGGLVLIEHPGGWVSAYGHLDQVAVRPGDRVRTGAVIATSGESGQVQEPQLYFQLRQNRRPVDPLRQLPAR